MLYTQHNMCKISCWGAKMEHRKEGEGPDVNRVPEMAGWQQPLLLLISPGRARLRVFCSDSARFRGQVNWPQHVQRQNPPGKAQEAAALCSTPEPGKRYVHPRGTPLAQLTSLLSKNRHSSSAPHAPMFWLLLYFSMCFRMLENAIYFSLSTRMEDGGRERETPGDTLDICLIVPFLDIAQLIQTQKLNNSIDRHQCS